MQRPSDAGDRCRIRDLLLQDGELMGHAISLIVVLSISGHGLHEKAR
ncbi:hypothetical protein QO016_002612 [Methylobacterium persicinum]|jgi:hypothetical protein|uniref:Uncharacterized protein n=1 Tax=Methylobacterium persicinum TaxID=374426 RepID=A0ABU0HNN7_9HYPH|nr:hypothetical protein [Methylobacterium persicinum]GJE38308.1 hypothetical protein KHHGKMAE_2379 [Methylobacterium persicinum]